MNLKKKGIVSIIFKIAIIILFLGMVIQNFIPQRIIRNTEDVLSGRVTYYGTEISTNINEITNILNKYKSRKTLNIYFPYESDKIHIEIDLVENHKPKHILLGEFNIWYRSSNKATYKILKAQELKDELGSILD